MKKLSIISTAFFAFAPFIITAQDTGVNRTPVHTGGNQITTMREKSQPATGSMFLNERYMPAKLSDEQNTVLLRYNAYSDFFEMSTPQTGEVKTLPKDPNMTITFVSNNESYAYVNYKTEDGEAISGYLNIIADNPNVKIYKRERIYLQPESFPNNSYQSYKAANYKQANDEFYVKIKDKDAVFFSAKKKDLAKLVPGKEKELKDFVKKNKIDLDKESGLEQLGNYMETIL